MLPWNAKRTIKKAYALCEVYKGSFHLPNVSCGRFLLLTLALDEEVSGLVEDSLGSTPSTHPTTLSLLTLLNVVHIPASPHTNNTEKPHKNKNKCLISVRTDEGAG